jgi:uncharacterized protein YggL (DUF469 family)
MKSVLNGERGLSRLCHICRGKLIMGEKYIWFRGCKGYVNICYKCMLEIGKLGEEIKEYNDNFLKQNKRKRQRDFKMLMELEKENDK